MPEPIQVLVIDDEAVVRDAISRVLRSEGYLVALAGDAAQALASPAAASCRLALCDLMLPDAPGAELVARLRQRRPKLPVVMMTGYLSGQAGLPDGVSGWTGFIPKPFDASELLAVVRQAVAAAAEEVPS